MARLAAWLTGGGPAGHGLFITREQIRSVIEMAERGANVDHFDRIRVRRAIRFAETTVGEAMIPIAEVAAVQQNLPVMGIQVGQRPQQQRLARTAGTRQAYQLTGRQ